MLDYLATFANTDGAGFPATQGVDSSGGAATDGTEFIAAMINDSMWGVWQALLNSVGLTPNGITEADGASQVLDALRRMDIPGKIIAVGWNDDPATLGIRAIMLTGQGVLRANYPELDALVYVGDANNAAADAFYHADDAAGLIRNTAGAYLIFPDGRGRVVRGLDLTGSVDPDGAGAYLGEEQEDAGQGWQLGASEDITGARDTYGCARTRDRTADVSASSGRAELTLSTTEQGLNRMLKAMNNGTDGDPRQTDQTRAKSLLFNLMITY